MEPSLHQPIVRITRSPAETRSLARRIASHLRPGDLLCLRGELGAGKTTFIQGLADGLGVTDPVTSPSFTLIHEHTGTLPFYHIDLYRLRPPDLSDLGLDDLIGSPAVVAVEWAERLPPHLCRSGLDIEITFDEAAEDVRRIHFRTRHPRGREILSCIEDRSLPADACAELGECEPRKSRRTERPDADPGA